MEVAARSEGSTCSASSEPQFMLTQQDPAIKATESRVTEVLQQFVKDVETRVFASLRETASEVAAHLAKEAASRMVTTERKAAFLEQELISTKSQALSMLLRLKHHTDSQIVDLEKLVVAERRRAADAEAKALTLQDALIHVKRRAGGPTCERAKNSQQTGDATVHPEDVSDSLALIAGVACDVMQEPRVSPGREKDLSSPSEEARDNAEVEDTPDNARAANLNTRSRKKTSNEEQLSASGEQSGGEDADDGEKGEDSADDGASNGRKRPSLRQSRLKRKSSKSVSTSEKLTRLMVGSKRARGKAARTSEPKQSVASSRDNRRLMQGARQLFSLAEKKW